MDVTYPPESGIEGFISQKGCLMGLPLSWFILNLLNLWAAEEATVEVARELRIPDWKIRDLLRIGVCGDDLASLMMRQAHRGYHRRISSTGPSFSDGKHLVSNTLILFTEQMAVFRQVERDAPIHTVAGAAGLKLSYLEAVEMVDVMPVRAIVEPGDFFTRPVAGLARCEMPSWATAGPAIASSIPAWASDRLRRRAALVSRRLRPEWKKLNEVGIPPELPREVGGGGFPPVRPNRAVRDAPRAWRHMLLWSLLNKDGGPVRKLRNLWQTSGIAGDVLEQALEVAAQRLPSMVIDDVTELFPCPREARDVELSNGGLCLPEDDALLRVAATWAPALAVGSFFNPRGFTMKFHAFAKKLKRQVQDTAHRITGRGGFRSGQSDSDILEAVRNLADGRVFVLSKEDVPPGLLVKLGNSLSVRKARWASRTAAPIRGALKVRPHL
jgi:hypothetical protein